MNNIDLLITQIVSVQKEKAILDTEYKKLRAELIKEMEDQPLQVGT